MPHGKFIHETPASISSWAEKTFGPTGSNMSTAVRANKEMSELLSALTLSDNHPKMGEEIADIIIVLWRLAHRNNIDIQNVIDWKMSKNRDREWILDGNGHGQHAEKDQADLFEKQLAPALASDNRNIPMVNLANYRADKDHPDTKPVAE